MKLSLLEYVQNILSALNSDQVNSISDTVESLQVAECVRTSYINMQGRYDLPEHNMFFQLQPSLNATQPTLMYRPDGITRMEWMEYFDTNPADGDTLQQDQYGSYSHDLNVDLVNNSGNWSTTSSSTVAIALGTATFQVPSGLASISPGQSAYAYAGSGSNSMSGNVISYNNTTLVLNITAISGTGTYSSWILSQNQSGAFGPGYQRVHIVPLHDFLRMVNVFDMTASDVAQFTLEVYNDSTNINEAFTFKYKNDHQPTYATIVSNNIIIFDSFDNTQDSTLQASKTRCYGWAVPVFQMVDTFIPNLDEQQIPLLLNEAKSLAFYEIKNQPHQKAEEEVARQLTSLQKWKATHVGQEYFDELPDFGRRGFRGTWKWLP